MHPIERHSRESMEQEESWFVAFWGSIEIVIVISATGFEVLVAAGIHCQPFWNAGVDASESDLLGSVLSVYIVPIHDRWGFSMYTRYLGGGTSGAE